MRCGIWIRTNDIGEMGVGGGRGWRREGGSYLIGYKRR